MPDPPPPPLPPATGPCDDDGDACPAEAGGWVGELLGAEGTTGAGALVEAAAGEDKGTIWIACVIVSILVCSLPAKVYVATGFSTIVVLHSLGV